MGTGQLYLDAQRSFSLLCRELGDADWGSVVPCTPEWTVWDVVSHVVGATDDIAHGRVDGAATDPWTASQVERWRDTPRGELLAQWDEQIEQVAALVDAIDEPRPAFDCHSHEHDVRHALGRPGNQDSALVAWMSDRFAAGSVGRPVDVQFADGTAARLPGDGEPLGLRGVSRFEFVRSRLGRRSRAQVASWAWSEPVTDAVLNGWFVFGPSATDIVE